MKADLHFENHGTLFTCTPQTDRGREWIDENVNSEGYQWLGKALCIEHRYAWNIFQGAVVDGLVCE